MAAWFVVTAVSIALSLLSGLIGLLVTLPVLGHATWHLYRPAVKPAETVRPNRFCVMTFSNYSVNPPSVMMVWPVTMLALTHKNVTTSAMSSGVHRRFITAWSRADCLRSSDQVSVHGVAT